MGQAVAKTRDPLNEIVRKNLRRFRVEAKLTAEQVAAFTRIPIDSLRRYEAGGSGVKYDVLVKLAEIYGHTTDDFGLVDPPKPDLKRRPALALMELDGVDADPAAVARIQKMIDDVNRELRDLKKPKK